MDGFDHQNRTYQGKCKSLLTGQGRVLEEGRSKVKNPNTSCVPCSTLVMHASMEVMPTCCLYKIQVFFETKASTIDNSYPLTDERVLYTRLNFFTRKSKITFHLFNLSFNCRITF